MDTLPSKYWLDKLLDMIAERKPSGEVLVASGITPSGPYHVGHSREILTAEAVRRGLEARGRMVRHMHNVDDFDALRKRYAYLPEQFQAEVGKPVYLVPSPAGDGASYAEHYFSRYAAAAEQLEIPMEIWRSHEEYQRGVFTQAILTALERRNEIADILKRISERDVPTDWQPIQILDITTQSLRTAEFLSYDVQRKLVEYRAADGRVHTADIATGQVKLDWRVDWPARWAILGVDVEGFGKEHATKGGSYDTGSAIIREIFEAEPPIPVPFNPIHLHGETKKMSSSLGNLITIEDALQIIPPDILRYFVFKSLPNKVLSFDPGLGMAQLIDEYAATESAVRQGDMAEFADAWRVAVLDQAHATVSTIPFTHLATVYQTARKDVDSTLALLERTHPHETHEQASVIKRELAYLDRWLDRFAPDSLKISLLDQPPVIELSTEEAVYLERLATALTESPWDGDTLQAVIFATAQAVDLQPKVAFQLLYKLFLGRTAGPKLGPFLASLEADFVLGRLRAMTTQG